jgi:hypothetical protein
MLTHEQRQPFTMPGHLRQCNESPLSDGMILNASDRTQEATNRVGAPANQHLGAVTSTTTP